MQAFTRILALAAATLPLFATAAPISSASSAEIIPGKYIIQLKPDVDISTIASHILNVREIHARNIAKRDVSEEETGGIEHEYGFGDFHGYSGSFDKATIAELEAMPEVLLIEPDTIMTTSDMSTQAAAPWGLASISSRTKGATEYKYDESAGNGTFTYVVDTGIRITHSQFGGRAKWGFNAVNTKNDDSNGHGTHVAGTVAGSAYGVAKKGTVVAVKIFEGNSGSTSTVISGFTWAVNDIVSKNIQSIAVINMSLGGAASSIWDAAITSAWASGVLSVVAAGNENTLASTRSPARSPEALTVGNIQQDDARFGGRDGSNYGEAVDIFAPGTGIVSAYRTSDSATASLTGTSMAAPHVAGLVSYLRGLEGPMSAAVVKARVLELGTRGRVTDAKGSANLLAYNGIGE